MDKNLVMSEMRFIVTIQTVSGKVTDTSPATEIEYTIIELMQLFAVGTMRPDRFRCRTQRTGCHIEQLIHGIIHGRVARSGPKHAHDGDNNNECSSALQ